MKKDNKGFSLVELIVVIAIMAVLMVVLTPALLRYVEKTRLQTDNSAIAEVANAAKISSASENINKEIIEAGGITVKFGGTNDALIIAPVTSGKTTSNFTSELNATIGAVKLKSNTYAKAKAASPSTEPVLTVSVNETTMAVTVTGVGIISEVGGTASTSSTPTNY